MRALFAVVLLAALGAGCSPPCPEGYHLDPIGGLVSYPGAPYSHACKKDDGPPFGGQAVSPSSQCAPQPDDDPCIACVRASCCSEALACADDAACNSLVQCSYADGGCTVQPDATYQATAACFSAHCPACGRLP